LPVCLQEKKIVDRQNKYMFILPDIFFNPAGNIQTGTIKVLIGDFFLSDKEQLVESGGVFEEIVEGVHGTMFQSFRVSRFQGFRVLER